MSKTNPTIKIVLRDYKKKDGSQSIFLRLTIDRKLTYFPVNICVNPNHFKSGTVSRSDPDYISKNILIDQAFIKAKKVIYDHRIQEKIITLDRFRRDYLNHVYGSESFYDFYEQQLELIKGTLSPNTVKCYVSQLKKLKQFRPKLTFSEITLDFILAYEGFIKNKLGNNKNTVSKSITFIKGMLTRAKDNGYIEDNPIKGYKFQRIPGNKEFLTLNELERLEKFYAGNHNLKPGEESVLKCFLFCCYTGLSLVDLELLTHNKIKDGILYYSRQKNGKPAIMPLIPEAKALIPQKYFDEQPVFKVFSGPVMNRYLKKIMKQAGIDKSISSHCGRKTFINLSLSIGIQLPNISRMVGHSSMKTTSDYLNQDIERYTQEMAKWQNRKHNNSSFEIG
ncbi:MAG: site-specific integrase [Bacteroidales bacterium]